MHTRRARGPGRRKGSFIGRRCMSPKLPAAERAGLGRAAGAGSWGRARVRPPAAGGASSGRAGRRAAGGGPRAGAGAAAGGRGRPPARPRRCASASPAPAHAPPPALLFSRHQPSASRFPSENRGGVGPPGVSGLSPSRPGSRGAAPGPAAGGREGPGPARTPPGSRWAAAAGRERSSRAQASGPRGAAVTAGAAAPEAGAGRWASRRAAGAGGGGAAAAVRSAEHRAPSGPPSGPMRPE